MLSGSFAQWQLPDTVIYLDALPRTSVGKFDKESQTRRLRRHLPPYNVTGPRRNTAAATLSLPGNAIRNQPPPKQRPCQ